jgi:hypothetical protein
MATPRGGCNLLGKQANFEAANPGDFNQLIEQQVLVTERPANPNWPL